MPEKVKQTRKRGPNVQSGCMTCRIRRKKCDTKKPSCLRCSSTGRTCDFLTQDSNARQMMGKELSGAHFLPGKYAPRLTLSYLAPLLIPSKDIPHFDYFRESCTEEFSYSFNPPLWKQVILQASYAEPFVLHAVLSIGALRRSQVVSSSLDSVAEILQYSKYWYRIATSELAELLKVERVDWKMALLGSLAFLAVEVLLGNESGALLHFRSGLNILKSFSVNKTTVSESTSQLETGDFDDVVTAFTRLSVEQFSFVGLQSSLSVFPTIPSHFDVLVNARESLNSIISSQESFLRQYGHPVYKTLPSHPLPTSIFVKQTALQAVLQSWLQKFITFLSSPALVQDVNHYAQVLLIQHLVAWIRISTHFFSSQLAYSIYHPDFKRIVDMTETVVDTDNESRSSSVGPCFTLDIAMAQPLYFVARFCRSVMVRRRAIEVLRRVGRKGVYTGRSLAKIADWIVETEERNSGHGSVGKLITLSDVSFDIREDGMSAEVCAVVEGPSGRWREIREVISLSS